MRFDLALLVLFLRYDLSLIVQNRFRFVVATAEQQYKEEATYDVFHSHFSTFDRAL